ncbi:TPA: hypothetical protein RQ360_001281 [Klebsiella michiganensis]|nr:hypothetical protein [Klebsiella michiganensis]
MDMKEPTEQELRDFLLRKYYEEQLNDKNDALNNIEQKVTDRYRSRLRSVDAEMLFKYLSEKSVSRHCQACGSEKLSVPQTGYIKTEQLPKDFDALGEAERGMIEDALSARYVQYVSFGNLNSIVGLRKSYYMVNCLNCGNLSLYRASGVLKWLEDQGSAEAKSNE